MDTLIFRQGLLLFFIATASSAVADEPIKLDDAEAAGVIIGEIRLDKHNVFDTDDPDEDNALYRLLNRLHIVTRDNIVHKQLLFSEGEPLVARELRETERILRRNTYLFDASVTIDRVENGVADLTVMTRDVWTLIPDVSLSRSGGENSSRYGVEEANLLGNGQLIRLVRDENVDRESTVFEFEDEHLGQSWTTLNLRFADNSDGSLHQLIARRPFIELDSRWAAGGSVIDDDRRIALYRLGDEAAEFQRDMRYANVFRGWSAGIRDGWVRRFTLGAIYDERRFGSVDEPSLPALVPENRKFVYPYIGFQLLEDRFEESSNSNAMGRTEDFFLGLRIDATLGYASESVGSDRDAWLIGIDGSKGFGSMESSALLTRFSLSGRIEDGDSKNVLATASATWFHRQSERWLFFASVSGVLGEELDLDQPVQLGGDTGLRGYPLRYQNGPSKLLFTVEQRYFTDWYPWRFFRVGAAVFFDVGRSFGESPLGEDSAGWLKDVGIGLRLAPTRGGTKKIVHIDLAFPLDGDDSIDDVQILLEAKRSF
ncbi:MAG: hypothetical protein AAF660_12120 [Pseudomonadota bacterium]